MQDERSTTKKARRFENEASFTFRQFVQGFVPSLTGTTAWLLLNGHPVARSQRRLSSRPTPRGLSDANKTAWPCTHCQLREPTAPFREPAHRLSMLPAGKCVHARLSRLMTLLK